MNNIIKQNAVEIINSIPILPKVDENGDKIKYTQEEVAIHVMEHLRANSEKASNIFQRIHLYNGKFWEAFSDEKETQNYLISGLIERSTGKIGTNRMITNTYKSAIRLFHFHDTPADKILVNAQNGVLVIDKEEVEMITHSSKFFFTYVLDFAYDDQADCPQFMVFLKQILPDDSILALQEFMGSILAGKALHFEKALLLFGGGSNGKSVLLEVFEKLYGSPNISHLELQDLKDANNRTMLVGKLVNIGTDSSANGLDNSIFKKVVSKEFVTYKVLFQDTGTTNDLPSFVFAMNNLPFTQGETSLGILRRMLLIPFDVTITEEQKDRSLAKKLVTELPGIFNFAVEGLFRLMRQNHFTESEAMKRVMKEFEDDINLVKRFVDDLGIVVSEELTSHDDLYSYFKKWCEKEGINSLQKRFMIKKLREMKFEQTHNDRIYGFRLTVNAREDMPRPIGIVPPPLPVNSAVGVHSSVQKSPFGRTQELDEGQ